MKRIHPKLSYAAALAALALSTSAGCKSQSGGIGNPFLAPGRVPPPATRALLPGEAQPYYPGDPLPVMQSRTGAPASGETLAAAEANAMPSATEILKWGSPKAEPETISAPPQQAIASNASPASAEPSVAIPADGGTLRFAAQAPPEPQPFNPPTASPITVQPAPNQVAATQVPQTVVPASYTAPTLASAEPVAVNPWRAPQQSMPQSMTLPPPPAPTMAAAAPAPLPISAPPLFAANNMDVRMRAVPSPPADIYSPTPRIRMPGHETTPYLGSNDGFRPRTSMR